MALTEQGKAGLKKLATYAVIIAIILLVVLNWSTVTSKFSFLTKKVSEVKMLKEADFEKEKNVNVEVRETADYTIPFVTLPTERRIPVPRMVFNHLGIMWNATAAFVAANGGEYTKQGSFFDKLGKEYGSPFLLKTGRQDDYSKQQDELALFAKEYVSSKGKVTDKGAAYVSFMGDNSEIYLQQANKKIDVVLKDFGIRTGEVFAQIFLMSGFSYGEDKAMGLKEWSTDGGDPKLALGQVFACYPQDGDQNLILKWAKDNGLLINPDGETYCYEAVNFQFTDGFMEAATAWGTMTSERVVVKIDPKTLRTVKTGEKHANIILGAGTWTPGDELVFKNAKMQKMDVVSLYSTKDNAHQMPCVFVTINKLINDQPGVIDAIVEGTVRAGDQMKVHDQAFMYGMKCMAETFKAKPASYWAKYFVGVKEKTVNGYDITLGGTRVCNLADNLDAFGIGDKARGTFQSTYELFGGFIHELYPEYMPKRLAYAGAVNLSSLERVAEKMKGTNEITKRAVTKFETGSIKAKVSERSYAIQFEIGKATLTSSGVKAMQSMYNDLNTHDLRITLGGHTDNTGSDDVNIPLSLERAKTVQNWLKQKNPASFPSVRFSDVKGYGSTMPLAGFDPNSSEGRDRNRRVEITVGY